MELQSIIGEVTEKYVGCLCTKHVKSQLSLELQERLESVLPKAEFDIAIEQDIDDPTFLGVSASPANDAARLFLEEALRNKKVP